TPLEQRLENSLVLAMHIVIVLMLIPFVVTIALHAPVPAQRLPGLAAGAVVVAAVGYAWQRKPYRHLYLVGGLMILGIAVWGSLDPSVLPWLSSVLPTRTPQ